MRYSLQVRRRLPAILLAGVVAAGCDAGGDSDATLTSRGEAADTSGVTAADSPRATDAPGDDPGPPPVEAVRETISIEGSVEVIDARRFRAPDAFPIPFETIVPGDMEIASNGIDGSREVRIVTAFAGIRRPDAYLSIVVLPGGTDEEEAIERTAALADSLGGIADERETLPWAVRSFRLTGPQAGFIALGERNGGWFQLRTSYPPEFGDGMGPRIALILRRWKWADGSALLPNLSDQ